MRIIVLLAAFAIVGCNTPAPVENTDGGASGEQGAPGAQGPQGPAGAAGIQGSVGPQGPQGVAGPAGNDGAPGAMGAQGPAGPQGPQGAPGVSNIPGPAGAQGAQGSAGPAGPQGPTGAQGATGPVGPTGPAGADGAMGASIVLKTKTNMQLGLPLPADGAFGITTGMNVLIYKSAVSGIADNWILGSQPNAVYFSGTTCNGDAFLNVSGAGNTYSLTQRLYWNGMSSDSNLYKITGTYSGTETINSVTYNAGPGQFNCKTISAEAATGFSTLSAAYNYNVPATLPWTVAVQ